MTNVINLRQKRKANARKSKETKAEENRILHGQTKDSKQLKAKKEALELKKIEAHKRGDDAETK